LPTNRKWSESRNIYWGVINVTIQACRPADGVNMGVYVDKGKHGFDFGA
jgi:hypothetical protein